MVICIIDCGYDYNFFKMWDILLVKKLIGYVVKIKVYVDKI